MKYQKIKEGIFIARPNRFVARVVVDGKEETVHVKNTGRCRELLKEGVKVYLEDFQGNLQNRKTGFSLVAVEKTGAGAVECIRLINMDSQAPNKAVGEGLAAGTIALPGFETGLRRIKSESTYGGSRFDFFVEGKAGQRAYIEVKGVTLESDGVVRFPDAPTERGVKHIKELCKAVEEGFLAYIIFVVQMKDVSYFEPNDVTHAAFGEALREAAAKGVQVLAYDCKVTPETMTVNDPVQVRLNL